MLDKVKVNPNKGQGLKPLAAGYKESPDTKRKKLAGKKFVFTSAQNNTYLNKEFFQALLKFCEVEQAQLVISRFSYNKNGYLTTKDDEGMWYDPLITPFVMDQSAQVAPDLIFCGELDILPTAEKPLSGLTTYTGTASAIIPHAKVAMESVPRMPSAPPRFLYTTGTVTQRNYIQRKAGQKAEFHHVFGALLVEIDKDGDWFARQLLADKTGGFYDLEWYYSSNKDQKPDIEHKALALNYGDIHIEKLDQDVAEATWYGKNSMARVLMPQNQFIHDLVDFTARNHHNIKDPFFLADRHFNDHNNVEYGMKQCADFLNSIDGVNVHTVVVESNHDLAFRKWLTEANIKYDPENAEFYHLSSAAIHAAVKRNDTGFSVFEWAIRNKDSNLINVTFLRENDSYVIGEIEFGLHGHLGPNGSRGTPENLKTIGRKCNTGHTHSAGIVNGVYTAGVSARLNLGYNKGPTSWSHSHIVTYANSKRAIVTIKRGKWRA